MQRLKRLLSEAAKPLAEARPDVPPGLAAIVDRLRSRDPAARPASADETITQLEPYLRPAVPGGSPIWDAPRKAALVLEVLQGKLDATQACERHGLARDEFEQWHQRFMAGAYQALDPTTTLSDNSVGLLRDLHAKIGVQAMEIEVLKKRVTVG